MKKIYVLLTLLGLGMCAGRASAQTEVADTTSIALGTVMGEMMRQQIESFEQRGLKVDANEFLRVFEQSFRRENTGMTFQQADRYMDATFRAIQEQQLKASALSEESQQAFIASAAAEPGAVTTPSGVVFQVITEGEGINPTDSDEVLVKYSGKLYDGRVFDQHLDSPIQFPVAGLIPGFTEALKMMKPGGTYRVVIPASMGYGEYGAGPQIPGNAALDFTITLDGIAQH